MKKEYLILIVLFALILLGLGLTVRYLDDNNKGVGLNAKGAPEYAKEPEVLVSITDEKGLSVKKPVPLGQALEMLGNLCNSIPQKTLQMANQPPVPTPQ